MKVAALIFGIIGGLISILFGMLGHALGGLANYGSAGSGSFLRLLSVGLPILALVGAGIVINKPVNGAIFMAVAALGLMMILGFNFVSMFPIMLLGVGALLGFLGSQQDKK